MSKLTPEEWLARELRLPVEAIEELEAARKKLDEIQAAAMHKYAAAIDEKRQAYMDVRESAGREYDQTLYTARSEYETTIRQIRAKHAAERGPQS